MIAERSGRPDLQPLQVAAAVVGSRSLSLAHKVRGLCSHVPGRLTCFIALVITARLLWVLVPADSPRASAVPAWLVTDLMGLSITAALGVLGARAPSRPPMILNTGDAGIFDMGVFSPVIVVAALMSRFPGVALAALYGTAVLVGIGPELWPTAGSRFILWSILMVLGVWFTTSRLVCSCVGWLVPRSRPLLALTGLAVPGVLVFTAVRRAGAEGIRSLDVFGEMARIVLAHAGATVTVALLLAAVNVMVLAVVSPRLTPLWVLPAYQVSAILDLAGGGEVASALALMHPPTADSRRIPWFVDRYMAFAARQVWEAARRRTWRVLLGEVFLSYVLSRVVGELAPGWWQVAFLGLGSLPASVCAHEGALAESRYPLYRAVSATRSAALAAAFWSCLLPAARACAVCLVYVGAGVNSGLDDYTVLLTLVCALTWPAFASACSTAAALLSTRGVPSRLTDSVGAVSALGGPLVLLAGDTASGLFAGPVALVSQVGVAAVASWAVLHLALARWAATGFTKIRIDSSAMAINHSERE